MKSNKGSAYLVATLVAHSSLTQFALLAPRSEDAEARLHTKEAHLEQN